MSQHAPQDAPVPSAAANGQGHFSQFYYALLEKQKEIGCSDLIVYVAYGIYKTEKQKEIERLNNTLPHPPQREDLTHFVDIAISHIDHYIRTAAEEQATFTKFVIDSLDNEAERETLNAAKKFQPTSWLMSAWYGCLGNFLWALLMALGAFVGLFGQTVQEAVQRILR